MIEYKYGTQKTESNIITDAVAVTPSDTTSLSNPNPIGLYVGGAGDVAVLLPSGVTLTFHGLLAGQVYPIRATRVNATNTTATNIVAVYG